MKNLIIFDFDGVLVDSLEVWYFINKAAAAKFGKHLSKVKYINSFLGNVHVGLKEVLNLNAREASEFSEHKDRLIKRFYKSSAVKFFPFAPKLIKYLAAKFDLYIVTSSPEYAVSGLLRGKKLEKKFKKIYGLNKHGKRHIFGQLAKQHPKGRLVFVTDTVGDIKEAKAENINTIAVGWGFHEPKRLKAVKPQIFMLKPRQLWSLFK